MSDAPTAEAAPAAATTYVTDFTALLSGLTWSGDGSVTGKPIFLGYSFETRVPDGYPDAVKNTAQAFTEAQKAMARAALDAWAQASGITFFETPEGTGTIRLLISRLSDDAGMAILPQVGGSSSFIFLNPDYVTMRTTLHEIGHALGLGHPFEGDVRLDPSLDDTSATVMSYTNRAGFGDALGTLDLQVIRHLYGGAETDGAQVAGWSWDAAAGGLSMLGFESADDLRSVGHGRIEGRGGDDVLRGGDGRDTLEGGDGDDTLRGAAAADRLTGGLGRDDISGDAGDDLIEGGDGNDRLNGGPGQDTLTGGAGDDSLVGYSSPEDGGGTDVLDGGDGADSLQVLADVVKVDGGAGNDTLFLVMGPTTNAWSYEANAAAGGYIANVEQVNWYFMASGAARTVRGTPVADLMVLGSGADSVYGGGGADSLHGEGGDDLLQGEDGADRLNGGDGADLLLGNQGADDLHGGAGDDRLFGGRDADWLWGEAGADFAQGDYGDDWLQGGAGADVLSGGHDNDLVQGGEDGDLLFGGEGNDVLEGGTGADFVAGDDGADVITNAGGVDLIFGGGGNDTVTAGGDGDCLLGNQDDDRLIGGVGVDTLFGGRGDDTLSGGAGDDWLSGDLGADVLTGGAGRDRFVFALLDTAVDRITDFDPLADLIDLSAIDADVNTAGDQHFQFVQAFEGRAGQAVLSTSGAPAGFTRLRLDVNGDGQADFVLDIAGQVSWSPDLWAM